MVMKRGLIVDACAFSEGNRDQLVFEQIKKDKIKILTARDTGFHRELMRADEKGYIRKEASKGNVTFINGEHVKSKSKQIRELKKQGKKRISSTANRSQNNVEEALIKSNDFDALAIGITAKANRIVTMDNKLSEDFKLMKQIESHLCCVFSKNDWRPEHHG